MMPRIVIRREHMLDWREHMLPRPAAGLDPGALA
jgi:hypothetical protein